MATIKGIKRTYHLIKDGNLSEKKSFLNLRETSRGNWSYFKWQSI